MEGAIENFGMEKDQHLRIGGHSRLVKAWEVDGIPRLTVYNGNVVVSNEVPSVASEVFRQLIEQLLEEGSE